DPCAPGAAPPGPVRRAPLCLGGADHPCACFWRLEPRPARPAPDRANAPRPLRHDHPQLHVRNGLGLCDPRRRATCRRALRPVHGARALGAVPGVLHRGARAGVPSSSSAGPSRPAGGPRAAMVDTPSASADGACRPLPLRRSTL
ncbi:MAG: Arginine/ornithine antiporter ArcD, partial [uncultured Rubellimicrobium sp.]